MRTAILAFLAIAISPAINAQVPQGVSNFGHLQVGGPSPVQPGDPTAHPHKFTPHAKFYVLIVAKGIPTMCTFEDCGPEGTLVETMGGWITGDAQNETIQLAGLNQLKVKQGKQSLVVISDKARRIVGIYPNSHVNDLPYILKAHGFSNGTESNRAPR